MSKIILTDVDGVLVSWIHGFDDLMLKYGHKKVIQHEYNLSKAYDVSQEVINKVAHEFVTSDVIASLPAILESQEAVRYLHEEHGYVFHCITAISDHPTAHVNRLKNLQDLYGKSAIYDLNCVAENSEKNKILNEYKNSNFFWVEDHAENYELGFNYGLRSLLAHQEWNRDYKEVPGTRMYDWHEIANKVLGKG